MTSVNRRDALRLSTAAAGASLLSREADAAPQSVERWEIFEIAQQGPASGNPFLDVTFSAVFTQGKTQATVDGFYDGDGVYRIRFMPGETGTWHYRTSSNISALNGHAGSFRCTPAKNGNHGPVHVRDKFHFGHADGTPYFPIGTTCYAWVFQTEERQLATLKALKDSPFNKIRMCLFPKFYIYNESDPPVWPFPREGTVNDYTHFNPEYFRRIETRIGQLRDIGVEADLILFHPYDRWGFQEMPAEVDQRYLRYVIARFGAYRNVWWSMANEFDFMKAKTPEDWKRNSALVANADPYRHLLSIHYSGVVPDYKNPVYTHAGVQSSDLESAAKWRAEYGKPLIYDECRYEGDIFRRWGSLSAEDMTHRHWQAVMGGGYGGHSETYIPDDGMLWWSHGIQLKGDSPPRIRFMRQLLEDVAVAGGGPIGLDNVEFRQYLAAQRANQTELLFYFGTQTPSEFQYTMPAGRKYKAEWIDTQHMKRVPLPGEHAGDIVIRMPSHRQAYALLRFTAIA